MHILYNNIDIMESIGRINKYDNLKGLAIILIVLGHMCLFPTIKGVIYIIHLPIFFFVAGYFSKIGPDEPIKAFKRLFIPFFVFCIIYELFDIFVMGGTLSKKMFVNPGYALWFLISLFTMKMLLPILDKLRYPILTAFILALLIGFIDVDLLGISRTFVFLPIFLVGFYYKDLSKKIKFRIENNLVLVLLLILTLVSCVIVAYNVPFDMILFKAPYKNYNILNILIRAVILILGGANVLILNKLMTNSENILTKFGRNSMSVYVLHVYFVVLLRPIMQPLYANRPILFLIAMVVISLAIVYVLSRDFVSKGVNKLTDSVYNLITKNV